MEGGLDVEAHAAQEEEPKQTSGAAETEEGNKFQKAIGAWRSMAVYLSVYSEMLTRSRY
jgi:homeobox protein cut-like